MCPEPVEGRNNHRVILKCDACHIHNGLVTVASNGAYLLGFG
jgi:hypothetical protein